MYIQVAATKGSAPRDAGTAMKVTANSTAGTIGGGALEHRAIQTARSLLGTGQDQTRTFPLGPDLGQCCGGAVTLRFTPDPHPLDALPRIKSREGNNLTDPIWVWGAGHVGRAVIAALPKSSNLVTWIDTAADRYPDEIPEGVAALPAADMPLLAARAPAGAHHLIFTYSHEIDLALCAALLARPAASIGLIGSATKRARFFKRLKAAGLDPSPITCPIGDKRLGKAPADIAQGVVQSLLDSPKVEAVA